MMLAVDRLVAKHARRFVRDVGEDRAAVCAKMWEDRAQAAPTERLREVYAYTAAAIRQAMEKKTEKCRDCNGSGRIGGAYNLKFIPGYGHRRVPLKCSKCKGTGRTEKK